MDWRSGFDRLASFLAAITFFVIAGVIAEDVWDDNDFAMLTSLDWAVFAGSAIGGGLAVFFVIRGIGWVASGFLTRKDDSPMASQPAVPEIADSQQDR